MKEVENESYERSTESEETRSSDLYCVAWCLRCLFYVQVSPPLSSRTHFLSLSPTLSLLLLLPLHRRMWTQLFIIAPSIDLNIVNAQTIRVPNRNLYNYMGKLIGYLVSHFRKIYEHETRGGGLRDGIVARSMCVRVCVCPNCQYRNEITLSF